jgi:hypothetical protein
MLAVAIKPLCDKDAVVPRWNIYINGFFRERVRI